MKTEGVKSYLDPRLIGPCGGGCKAKTCGCEK